MGGCINRASGAAVPAAPLDTRRHVADHPPPLAYTSPNACRALKVSSLVVILSAAAAAAARGLKMGSPAAPAGRGEEEERSLCRSSRPFSEHKLKTSCFLRKRMNRVEP